MKRIKKRDTVIIISGKSQGHVGEVLKIFSNNTLLVDGGNMMKKHVKPDQNNINKPHGIVAQEAPIHVSNVAMYNPDSKQADKIGFKKIEIAGKECKVRYFKSNGAVVDKLQ